MNGLKAFMLLGITSKGFEYANYIVNHSTTFAHLYMYIIPYSLTHTEVTRLLHACKVVVR